MMLFLPMMLAAHAEELAMSVSLPQAAPQELIFPAPTAGPLPSVWIAGADGRTWVVSVAVAPLEAGQYQLSFRVESLEADRKGRLHREVVSQPRITTLAGIPATITQGSRRQVTDASGEVHVVPEEEVRIEAVLRD